MSSQGMSSLWTVMIPQMFNFDKKIVSNADYVKKLEL